MVDISPVSPHRVYKHGMISDSFCRSGTKLSMVLKVQAHHGDYVSLGDRYIGPIPGFSVKRRPDDDDDSDDWEINDEAVY